MIDEADRAAIKILADKAESVANNENLYRFERFATIKTLHNAIRHLAYPARDVYPKVRGSKKGDPIVRRRYNYDDVR